MRNRNRRQAIPKQVAWGWRIGDLSGVGQTKRRYKVKESIFQFHSLLRLSACFFALVCFSSVGYASSPSETDNVHFCLPFKSDERDSHQYVARKQALNLNVGEPRTVRLIYFLPNDRSFKAEVVQNMKDEIRNIQTFYAEQMQAHGYGNKTFRFEADAQGEPLVHRVDGQHPDSHYLDYSFATLIQEIEQTFDLEKNIYFIIVDNSIGRAIGGVSGRGGRLRNGGIAIFPRGFNWRIAAHELGHAFGLEHNFRDDAYMMSYGSHWNRLSVGNAEFLTVHPYFNSDTSSSTGAGEEPTIELISPAEYPVGSNSVSIQLKISDSDGLHQAILFVNTVEPHPAAGFREVKTFLGLGGKKDATVEFEYDGVIPSLGYTRLSDPSVHPIRVMVVDTDGNVSQVSFSVFELSPYYIATLEERKVGESTYEIFSVAFSPEGTLASGANDGTVKLWDVAKKSNIDTLEMFAVRAVAFSPDGKILAAGGYGRKIRLRDVATGEDIAILDHKSTIWSLAFSSDGTLLASASDDRTVKLWDVATRTNIATLEGHTDVVASVAFSPDGTLASGSWDNTVKLWDVATGENIATLEEHEEQVRSVAFSPDGTLLASGSEDNTVKLWDVATRTNIATLGYYKDCAGVYSVAFSPDGTILASGSWDNMVRLWDIATRTNIAILNREYYDTLISVAFSSDGTTLATGSWHGKVNLWDTSEYVTPVVSIPDANLRAVIQDVLQKSRFAPITVTDMASLTALDASNRDIRDLTGLEFATNLTALNLADNPLSSLSITTHIPDLQSRGVEVLFARSPTADFDRDGVVDFADFLQFAVQFGLSRGDAGYDAQFDLDGDGIIGFGDFLIFVDAFGE